MKTFIRKLARGNKGVEPLQAVILLGAGFVVTLGLMTMWGEVKPTVKTEFEKVATGK